MWRLLKRLGRIGGWIDATVSVVFNWQVIVSAVAGFGAGGWAWATQWGYLPIALTGLGVFVAVLWAWNGIVWFRRQKTPAKARVAFDYRYSLALDGVHIAYDPDKEEATLQLGLILHNAAEWPMKYHVKDISVILGDRTIGEPEFINRGGIVSRMSKTIFLFPSFIKDVVRPNMNGTIKYTIEYGHPDFEFVRISKKHLRLTLKVDEGQRRASVVHLIQEETDEELAQVR